MHKHLLQALLSLLRGCAALRTRIRTPCAALIARALLGRRCLCALLRVRALVSGRLALAQHIAVIAQLPLGRLVEPLAQLRREGIGS